MLRFEFDFSVQTKPKCSIYCNNDHLINAIDNGVTVWAILVSANQTEHQNESFVHEQNFAEYGVKLGKSSARQINNRVSHLRKIIREQVSEEDAKINFSTKE